jgi:glyoxylase-like metal-dependent hydrolase (beta-lactamase superfamily II)
MFDTGCYANREILIDALKKRGLVPSDIHAIILSHLHYDHSLNLPLFEHATVYVSRKEIEYAEEVGRQRKKDFAIPDNWRDLLARKNVVEVEATLQLAAEAWVTTLPGHTPGSLVLFLKKSRTVAVCGDAIKNTWEAIKGNVVQAFGNRSEARKSIRRIISVADLIVPGHDRALCLKPKGVYYPQRLTWNLIMNLYPDYEGKVIFRLRRWKGIVPYSARPMHEKRIRPETNGAN